jgi:hypothetical protein
MKERNAPGRRKTSAAHEMKLGKMLIFIALAGCSSSGDFSRREAPQPEALSNQLLPHVAPQEVAPNTSNLSPAAKAASPSNVSQSEGQLMDCVTQSCKINCSPNVAPRFRPKWCSRFKEPI